MGPRAGLDALKYSKIFFPSREENPRRPARNPSLYRLSYPGFFPEDNILHNHCCDSLKSYIRETVSHNFVGILTISLR
jgi:hypothetical protein